MTIINLCGDIYNHIVYAIHRYWVYSTLNFKGCDNNYGQWWATFDGLHKRCLHKWASWKAKTFGPQITHRIPRWCSVHCRLQHHKKNQSWFHRQNYPEAKVRVILHLKCSVLSLFLFVILLVIGVESSLFAFSV